MLVPVNGETMQWARSNSWPSSLILRPLTWVVYSVVIPISEEASMPRRWFAMDQIIQHLREAEVHLSHGQTGTQVYKMIGVTDQTYDRWRKEYGGL